MLHSFMQTWKKVQMYWGNAFGFWKERLSVEAQEGSLYGLCQAPCAFWKFHVEKLKACGMSQFKLYPCLFI